MIDFEKYRLKKEYFDYLSKIHSIDHTYRVMILVLKLGKLIGEDSWLAFNAAFIHDMARRNDQIDPYHGWRACKTKCHLLNLPVHDLREVQTAVYNHCEPSDIMKQHPHYTTAMILKDADMLDRVRLPIDIDWNRSRFKETRELEDYARNLNKQNDLFEVLVSWDKK